MDAWAQRGGGGGAWTSVNRGANVNRSPSINANRNANVNVNRNANLNVDRNVNVNRYQPRYSGTSVQYVVVSSPY